MTYVANETGSSKGFFADCCKKLQLKMQTQPLQRDSKSVYMKEAILTKKLERAKHRIEAMKCVHAVALAKCKADCGQDYYCQHKRAAASMTALRDELQKASNAPAVQPVYFWIQVKVQIRRQQVADMLCVPGVKSHAVTSWKCMDTVYALDCKLLMC